MKGGHSAREAKVKRRCSLSATRKVDFVMFGIRERGLIKERNGEGPTGYEEGWGGAEWKDEWREAMEMAGEGQVRHKGQLEGRHGKVRQVRKQLVVRRWKKKKKYTRGRLKKGQEKWCMLRTGSKNRVRTKNKRREKKILMTKTR